MLTDALVSFGVVVGGAVVYFTGWRWVDPAIAFGLLGVIAYGSWGQLSLNAVPANVDLAALLALPDVTQVHDLHLWPLSTTDTVLTVHLVRTEGGDNAFLAQLQHDMQEQFQIGYCTAQIECLTPLRNEPGVCH